MTRAGENLSSMCLATAMMPWQHAETPSLKTQKPALSLKTSMLAYL